MGNGVLEKWIVLSEDDIDNAKIMFEKNKFLISTYFLHQATEKILKSFYLFSFNEEPPYTHNLIHLENKINLISLIDDSFSDLLIELNPYYIIARYPNYKTKMNYMLNKIKVDELIKRTEDLVKCLKQKMK